MVMKTRNPPARTKGDIMNAMNPLGKYFCARDGGLHAPLDRSVFDRVNAQATTGGRMEVRGTAYQYGVVGHFWFGAMRLEAGSLVLAPGTHRKYRDALALYAHDSSQVLARMGNNTMDLEFGQEAVTYAMRLNEADSLARDVWARLLREDLNASSIGFLPVEGEWVKAVDNSLDADPENAEEIDVFSVAVAYLAEVSLVPHGAFAGATSMPAGHDYETIDMEVRNSIPVAKVAVDAIVEADDGTEGTDSEPAEAESAGEPEGDPGDDSGDGESVDGGAAPDGAGTAGEEARQRELAAWLKDQEIAMARHGIDKKEA